MVSSMIEPLCLFKSSEYKVLYKAQGIHFDELLPRGETGGWEPVHRLDYETSGLLLFAQPNLVEPTRELFQRPGAVEKIYLAGTSEALPFDNEAVEGHIGSRYRSSKKVKFFFKGEKLPGAWHSMRPASLHIKKIPGNLDQDIFTGHLCEVQLHTGARHQIRATLAAYEKSIKGDALYNPTFEAGQRLELHAWKLKFSHPLTGSQISVEVLPQR